jgi:hypothetical protein
MVKNCPPLDSRVAKWINTLPATFGINTKRLSNAQYCGKQIVTGRLRC